MGNGPRLIKKEFSVDVETGGLKECTVISPFGTFTADVGKTMFWGGFGGLTLNYPEYGGTPWATSAKLSKREHAIAGLHTTLHKLGALKNVDEEAFENIRYKSMKRLKHAKWAQYQKKKNANT